MARSKHTFTIEAEFDSSEDYDDFVMALQMHGAQIVDETSDF